MPALAAATRVDDFRHLTLWEIYAIVSHNRRTLDDALYLAQAVDAAGRVYCERMWELDLDEMYQVTMRRYSLEAGSLSAAAETALFDVALLDVLEDVERQISA
jgi:hypothetical protein